MLDLLSKYSIIKAYPGGGQSKKTLTQKGTTEMNTYAAYESNSDLLAIFVNTTDKGLICWSTQDPEAFAADIAYILTATEQRSGLYEYELEGEEAEAELAMMEASGRLLSSDGEHATPDMCQGTQGEHALNILRSIN